MVELVHWPDPSAQALPVSRLATPARANAGRWLRVWTRLMAISTRPSPALRLLCPVWVVIARRYVVGSDPLPRSGRGRR